MRTCSGQRWETWQQTTLASRPWRMTCQSCMSWLTQRLPHGRANEPSYRRFTLVCYSSIRLHAKARRMREFRPSTWGPRFSWAVWTWAQSLQWSHPGCPPQDVRVCCLQLQGQTQKGGNNIWSSSPRRPGRTQSRSEHGFRS